jgi:hypothetical protein
MRDVIQSILANEVGRLKSLSDKTGLELDDVRKLDLLIKAHRAFQGDSSNRDTDAPESPASESVSELLDGLEVVLPKPI